MEKRVLLAIVLSLAVLVTWQILFMPEPPEPSPHKTAPRSDLPASTPADNEQKTSYSKELPADSPDWDSQVDLGDISSDPTPDLPQRILEISTSEYHAKLSSTGAHFISWELLTHLDTNKNPLQLIYSQEANYYPGDVRIEESNQFNELNFQVDYPEDFISLNVNDSPKTINLSARTPDGVELNKTFTFRSDSIVVDCDLDLLNRSPRTI